MPSSFTETLRKTSRQSDGTGAYQDPEILHLSLEVETDSKQTTAIMDTLQQR